MRVAKWQALGNHFLVVEAPPWSITPARARQELATEAAFACRDWVFATLPVDHVISLILPDNTPSRGVAENLEMTVWKQVPWPIALPQTHLVYRLDRPEA